MYYLFFFFFHQMWTPKYICTSQRTFLLLLLLLIILLCLLVSMKINISHVQLLHLFLPTVSLFLENIRRLCLDWNVMHTYRMKFIIIYIWKKAIYLPNLICVPHWVLLLLHFFNHQQMTFDCTSVTEYCLLLFFRLGTHRRARFTFTRPCYRSTRR